MGNATSIYDHVDAAVVTDCNSDDATMLIKLMYDLSQKKDQISILLIITGTLNRSDEVANTLDICRMMALSFPMKKYHIGVITNDEWIFDSKDRQQADKTSYQRIFERYRYTHQEAPNMTFKVHDGDPKFVVDGPMFINSPFPNSLTDFLIPGDKDFHLVIGIGYNTSRKLPVDGGSRDGDASSPFTPEEVTQRIRALNVWAKDSTTLFNGYLAAQKGSRGNLGKITQEAVRIAVSKLQGDFPDMLVNHLMGSPTEAFIRSQMRQAVETIIKNTSNSFVFNGNQIEPNDAFDVASKMMMNDGIEFAKSVFLQSYACDPTNSYHAPNGNSVRATECHLRKQSEVELSDYMAYYCFTNSPTMYANFNDKGFLIPDENGEFCCFQTEDSNDETQANALVTYGEVDRHLLTMVR